MKLKCILLVTLFFASLSVSAQRRGYEGKIEITPLQFEQIGDSLYIKLMFNINEVSVPTSRFVSVRPVVVSSQNKTVMPEVMIKGRNDYRTYVRNRAIMGKRERALQDATSPYTILKGYSTKENQVVEYNKVILFEPWMADARLDVQEDLCGCCDAPATIATRELFTAVKLEKAIEPYQVTASLAYVRPDAEPIKHRDMAGEAFLDFAVNKTDIRSEYMNNPRELKKITDMINEVATNKNITVNSISVIGYSSPEGSLEGNKRLSEGREKALVGYLVPKFKYPRSLYKTESGGENWIGLKSAVENMDWQYKDEVLNILKGVPTESSADQIRDRKRALVNFKAGEPYRYLLREVYPALRVAICKIDYVVKDFELEDAKLVIKKRPQDLSLNEMFHVANSYENGSSEFIGVFDTAVRIFPNNQTANINAAAAALARNDISSAERYLSRVVISESTPEYDNILGVLAMLKGDYVEAEKQLTKAANAGLGVAKANLIELARKRENIKEINKQKRK